MPERKQDYNFIKDNKIHGEGNVLGTAQRCKDLMLKLVLIEIIGQLAMAGSFRWYDHVLRIEDCHVLRRA